MTIHNTHNRQTSMLPMGFEPTISAGERPKTYALDRAAIGTGRKIITTLNIHHLLYKVYIFAPWRNIPYWAMAPSLSRLYHHTKTHRTRLGSSGRVIGTTQRQHSSLTTDRQTSMPPAGFEHTIPASERPQTHVLDRVATGIGPFDFYSGIK